MVTLSEGGKPITMSAGQAVARATFVSALKGNSNAQRTILQMSVAARERSEKQRSEEYQQALLLKVQLEHDRKVWIASGQDESDMLRHPADLVIDHSSKEIRNFILYTEEQIAHRNKAIELRDHAFHELEQNLKVVEENGKDFILEMKRKLAENTIHFANECLPPRFRRTLPGGTPPISLDQSVDEIWGELMAPLTACFTKTAPGG
jgi:hypothetical protein